MRSILDNFPRVLAILIVGIVLTSCSYEDVEVREVRKVRIDRLDKNGIEFTASLYVTNPNGYRIKVTSTDAEVYLDGRKAGDASLKRHIVVPSNFEGEIEAKIHTDFEGGGLRLLPIIIGASVNRGVDLRVKGDLRARSFLIGRSFDFDYRHKASF